MAHFLAQFGPCLSLPWTRLTDVPAFDADLVTLIAGQSDAQSGHLSIRELERIRDANLVGFLRVLKAQDWGAGRVLNAHDAARAGDGAVSVALRPDWAEVDGTLGEAGWLAAARAVAPLSGQSRTTDTRIRQPGTARPGETLTASVQMTGYAGARHLCVTFARAGVPVAVVERRLSRAGAARAPSPAVAGAQLQGDG